MTYDEIKATAVGAAHHHLRHYQIPLQVLHAAIDAYLSKMPTKWGIKHDNYYDLSSYHDRADADLENQHSDYPGQVVEVAIVELPEVK